MRTASIGRLEAEHFNRSIVVVGLVTPTRLCRPVTGNSMASKIIKKIIKLLECGSIVPSTILRSAPRIIWLGHTCAAVLVALAAY